MLGAIEMDKYDVIRICNERLANVEKSRRRQRRKSIKWNFQSEVWWWRKIWRHFGYSAPTRQKAIQMFEDDPYQTFKAGIIGWKTFDTAKDMLKVCEKSTGKVWVTEEFLAS